jgi:hypothetical protein
MLLKQAKKRLQTIKFYSVVYIFVVHLKAPSKLKNSLKKINYLKNKKMRNALVNLIVLHFYALKKKILLLL